MLISESFYAPRLLNHAIHTKLLVLESCDEFSFAQILEFTDGLSVMGVVGSIGARVPTFHYWR
jgi:hypothetical protein